MDFSNPVKIKASAKLIYQLGEQLISDELVALLELIKNSYDADATSVQVLVDNNADTKYGKGLITIKDNGNGMIPSIIINGFLRLSTNYKKINKFSPYYNRKTLGEKGLGRLSFQRLGRFIEVKTTPRLDRLSLEHEIDQKYVSKEENNSFKILLDWNDFTEDADFDDITANVIPIRENDLNYGTCIKIYGIRNENFWILNQEKRTRLQGEILSMTNPFISNKTNDKFNLSIDVNGEKFLVDSIDEKIVDQLSDVSAYFNMDNGILKISIENKRKYFNRIKDEYIENQKNFGFEIEEDNCEFDNYKDKKLVIDFNEESVLDSIPWMKEDIFHKINKKYAIDFSFSGHFYAVDKSAANKTDITTELLSQSIFIQKNFSKIGELWGKIAGVYVYRDKFRVLPYGQSDWLDFTRRSQKSKATIYKVGNVSGYIQIDGKKSEFLKEQTDRQGILKDEYGFNFLNILERVITEQIFKWDTGALRANFARPKIDKNTHFYYNADRSIKFKELIQIDNEYYKQEMVFNDLVENINQSNSPQLSLFDDNNKKVVDEAIKYRDISKEYHKELKQQINTITDKLDEYKEIIPLLGQTIIMESVTHEFQRIYSKLAATLATLDKMVKNQNINEKKQFDNILKEFSRGINDLDMQLNHIAPTHRNKLKDESDIEFRSFIIDNYIKEGVISNRLKGNGVICKVNDNTLKYKMSLGNAIVIFDNLVLNSEYWLEKYNIKTPVINFDIESRYITIWDNGRGIDPLIENVLFEPFKSQKESGRGLGLYIVQELLGLIGSSIELLADRNSYGNRYKFKIMFLGDSK